MRITVIPEDRCIVIDGDAVLFRPEAEFPAVDANCHAIQWYGEHGVCEVKIGEREWFTDAARMQVFIDAHAVEKVAQAEAEL